MRTDWSDLPEEVRTAIVPIGSASVVGISEGFSPGFIGHVTSGSSDRFVKLCTNTINPRTPSLHRAEARVLSLLPSFAPAPVLTDVIDLVDWVGLATEWVSPVGRSHPSWLDAAGVVLRELSEVSPPPSLPGLRAHLEQDFLWNGWHRLNGADRSFGSAWADQHATELLDCADAFFSAIDGHQLVHGDLRADNVVVGVDGTSVAVDWPSAAIGNPLFDAVMLIGSVALERSAEPSTIAAHLGVTVDDTLRSVAVGVLGHYAWASSLGDPPGIPGVRSYQAALRSVFERWVIDLCRQ
jgi:hypothetical protein